MNLDLKGTFLLRNRTLPADVEFVFVPFRVVVYGNPQDPTKQVPFKRNEVAIPIDWT